MCLKRLMHENPVLKWCISIGKTHIIANQAVSQHDAGALLSAECQ